VNTGSGTITVNPAPTLTLDTTNQTTCAGSEVTWTVAASGTGLSYQWLRDGTNLVEGSGNFTGTTNATLTNSAVATVDGVATTNGYACVISIGTCTVSSSTVSLTVNPLPTVSVNSDTVCAGSAATITATTSASSPAYLWSPGGATTASITVTPASTTTYTVTVTDGTTGCVNTGSGTVTVNPPPTVSVNSDTVCAGSAATITATTSASSPAYLWSPGGATTASITVTPASTTTYTVTVTDGTTGCVNTGSGTVTVNPLPTVSVNSATICTGGSATLTATTSASSPSYLWSPGGATTASISVTPASTTTYTVAVTDGTTGCQNSGTGTVTVEPAATASAGGNQTIFAVNSTTGLGGVIGGGATGGTWSSTGTGTFSPGATTLNATYAPSLADASAGSVTLTLTTTGQLSPCGPAVAQVVVTINPLPVVLTGTRLYDGTTAATNTILTVSNKSGSDDVYVSSGNATLASSFVGTNLITSAGTLALGGTTAPKYTLTGVTGSVVVTDPELPFSITQAYLDGPDDGTSHFITVFQSVPGVTYQLLGSGDFGAPLNTWTNVGSAITATDVLTTNSIPDGSTKAYIYKKK
jgi:hypothetical protein